MNSGQRITRDHPEHVLITKLEKCENARQVMGLALWVCDEVGYRDFVMAAWKKVEWLLEQARSSKEVGKEGPEGTKYGVTHEGPSYVHDCDCDHCTVLRSGGCGCVFDSNRMRSFVCSQHNRRGQ